MNRIDSWTPAKIPSQALVCMQSGFVSFTVCIIMTRGDRTAAVTSAAFAALACVIHMVCEAFLRTLQAQLPLPLRRDSSMVNVDGLSLFLSTLVFTWYTVSKCGYDFYLNTSFYTSLAFYPPGRVRLPAFSPPVFVIVAEKIKPYRC